MIYVDIILYILSLLFFLLLALIINIIVIFILNDIYFIFIIIIPTHTHTLNTTLLTLTFSLSLGNGLYRIVSLASLHPAPGRQHVVSSFSWTSWGIFHSPQTARLQQCQRQRQRQQQPTHMTGHRQDRTGRWRIRDVSAHTHRERERERQSERQRERERAPITEFQLICVIFNGWNRRRRVTGRGKQQTGGRRQDTVVERGSSRGRGMGRSRGRGRCRDTDVE